MKNNNNKGYTLVELIVVIGLGVFALLIFAAIFALSHFIMKLW